MLMSPTNTDDKIELFKQPKSRNANMMGGTQAFTGGKINGSVIKNNASLISGLETAAE